MHEKGEKQGREISEDRLREILNDTPDHAELCEDFIQLTRMRGSLMEERFGMYRFIHLAFQEFLAARYLAEVLRREEKIVKFFQNNRIANSWWREVILLTIGYLTMNSSATADNVIRQLAGLDDESAKKMIGLPSDIQIASAGLAWSAVSEWPEAPKNLVEEVPDRFLKIFHNDTLFPNSRKRVEAGNLLGKLGDPRFRPDRWYLPDDDLFGFVEIPGGDFLMGNDNDKNASPQHVMQLNRYFIARYPVTVAQYRSFVTESGYIPSDKGCIIDIANHPVSLFEWGDARAYCNWLNNRLRQWSGLPTFLLTLFENEGFRVCLPSEAEWEKAARGEDGRIYPWGEVKPDSTKANYSETGMGKTTPVGCFPAGVSPYGLVDCAGNLWEWTRSIWGEDLGKPLSRYPYNSTDNWREDENAGCNFKRILRGGAFSDECTSLACACRNWNRPVYKTKFKTRGFRIALVVKKDIP